MLLRQLIIYSLTPEFTNSTRLICVTHIQFKNGVNAVDPNIVQGTIPQINGYVEEWERWIEFGTQCEVLAPASHSPDTFKACQEAANRDADFARKTLFEKIEGTFSSLVEKHQSFKAVQTRTEYPPSSLFSDKPPPSLLITR